MRLGENSLLIIQFSHKSSILTISMLVNICWFLLIITWVSNDDSKSVLKIEIRRLYAELWERSQNTYAIFWVSHPSCFVTENRTNPYIFIRLRNKSLTPLPSKCLRFLWTLPLLFWMSMNGKFHLNRSFFISPTITISSLC